jgi:hypothetical protein
MTRIQLLYLPSDAAGNSRWALVADQADGLSGPDREALRAFAHEAGAQGCVVLSGTVDVAPDAGIDGQDEELAQQLAAGFRAASQPPQQPPKLPPANTTEGKLARSWQGRQQLAQGDPQ